MPIFKLLQLYPLIGVHLWFFLPYFTKPTVKQAGNNNKHIEMFYVLICIFNPVSM